MILTIVLMVLWITNAAMMLGVTFRRRPYTSSVDGFSATESIPYLMSINRCGPYVFVPLAWLSVLIHIGDIKYVMDVVGCAFAIIAPGFAAHYWYKHANMKAEEYIKDIGNHPMKVSRAARIQFMVALYVFFIICCILFSIDRSSVVVLPAGMKWTHIVLLCVSICLTCRRPPWMWDVLETQWAAKVTYGVAVMSLLICVNNIHAMGTAFMYLGSGYMLMGLLKPGDQVPKKT